MGEWCLKHKHHAKGQTHGDHNVGQAEVDHVDLTEHDVVLGQGVDPPHHQHVNQVAGVGQLGQRTPGVPGQKGVNRSTITLKS